MMSCLFSWQLKSFWCLASRAPLTLPTSSKVWHLPIFHRFCWADSFTCVPGSCPKFSSPPPYIHCQLTRPLNPQRVGHRPLGELATDQIKESKQQTEHTVPHHRIRHSVGISSITDFFFHYTTPRNLQCMSQSLSWLSPPEFPAFVSAATLRL